MPRKADFHHPNSHLVTCYNSEREVVEQPKMKVPTGNAADSELDQGFSTLFIRRESGISPSPKTNP